jgi:hypothetical protein
MVPVTLIRRNTAGDRRRSVSATYVREFIQSDRRHYYAARALLLPGFGNRRLLGGNVWGHGRYTYDAFDRSCVLRDIAVTSAKRSESMPDVPAVTVWPAFSSYCFTN